MRVVVVDDYEALRALLRELLHDVGHVVVAEAADGRAGVRAAERHRPELVIIDWSMPLLDGVAATREIRSSHPEIPVIAFSSANDPGVRAAFLQAGAAAYVEKPNVDDLLAAVAQLANPPTRSTPAQPDCLSTAGGFAIAARNWSQLTRTQLAPSGPLTGDAADQLLAAIDDHSQPGALIILDLSEITAIDDRGSAAIARCSARAAAKHAELEIQHPSRVVRHALERSDEHHSPRLP